MELALQGPTCVDNKKGKVDLHKLYALAISEDSTPAGDDNKLTGDDSSSEELTDSELKAIDDELTKIVTPEQKKHAMRIFRGFRHGATENEKGAALVSFKKS